MKKVKETLVILPDKTFDDLSDEINYSTFKQGVLIVAGEINHHLAGSFLRGMLYLLDRGHKEIKVIISSPGGAIYPGLEIYNAIKDAIRRGAEVTTEARGLCASMAVIILCAGNWRTAYPATRFLLHELSSAEFGKLTELEEGVQELKQLNTMLKEIIAETTGQSAEKLGKLWHKKNLWMGAKEALEFGLIEEILE